jgi:hypothetical protein
MVQHGRQRSPVPTDRGVTIAQVVVDRGEAHFQGLFDVVERLSVAILSSFATFERRPPEEAMIIEA